MVAVVKKIVIMYDNCFLQSQLQCVRDFKESMFVQVLKTCPAMHFRNMDVLSLNNYDYTKKRKLHYFF